MPHSRKASNSALDVLRQVGRSGGLNLGEEGRGVLLHQAVQSGLLGAVTLVVDRGAIRHPVGLPTDGLHAMFTSRLWCLRGLKPSGAPPFLTLAPTSGCPPQMTSDWNGELADDAPSAAKKKESQADHDAALDDIGAADSDERADWGGDRLGAA